MLSPNSPSDVAKNVAIIILAGVAISLFLVALIYMLNNMDRWCDLDPGTVRQIDHGPVARKAGLWGLRQVERRAILEQILIEKPYIPDKSQDDISDVENAPPNVELLANDNVEMNEDEEAKDETLPVVANMEVLGDSQHNTTCAICLSDYVHGDIVLSGTSCLHIFHKTCAFEWLEKHDHCPYCRKEMMTPSEMRTTAEDILGEARIVEMREWGQTLELARNDFQDYSR